MDVPSPCNVLMLYPLFTAESFWSFGESCKLMGVRRPAAPLGLITVAAMLPESWTVRLIDCNTQALDDDELAWADVVFTGGMLPQQADTLRLIDMCRAAGKPVVVGGPDPTSSPHIYEKADFRVLGEAESVIDDFIAAWESGARSGTFTAPKFQADVTKTPVPRFDLLKFEDYLYLGVQYSRGCPFTCEFCDIIELYGRVPRTKTVEQMFVELETLYKMGYRGHLDFVDDNFIGNKKSLRQFLPQLAEWQRAHGYPFELSTEASVNLADDPELLELMGAANFFAIFVGIESPDPATLVAMRKKQNTRRNIAESIHKIYAAGMLVTAGFIVGFDNEKVSMADAMIDFIEEAAIPVAMVGLLYALPNTQLTRRLEREGRLHPGHDVAPTIGADQCTAGINFDPVRPLREILTDYKRVLEHIYSPAAYAGRIERLMTLLDRSRQRSELTEGDIRSKLGAMETVHKVVTALPEARAPLWQAFMNCAKRDTSSARIAVQMIAAYAHLGPYSRKVIAAIDTRLAAIEDETVVPAATSGMTAARHLA
ncbi:B12-binding domain-containing radical SAM protein [Bradyrhizobium sp. WBOS7]|uniref:B12-binding domain-containing radical SAM protein n=1 Tax=Bradyrhizobium betae TaxID=244734 RepID=A0AAE9NBD6_9BRAD|nr:MULTISPECIES: B12-binding domain-containing radical SAM protein [Bradyrhizobium]MDD1569719.1 B12-binding domain-containing radical SAM protein [Bradyrhizobium sp. WBOS1]UUO35800.1 B12-binding domain-containing radical SAM protein [Bradyrhizobium sp. WBOS01]MDD1526408.1 B12-binding domain-containing radical SAM protein [Bradyrhizobium sp. WBOS2]MDD1575818.1 B12-binding domain-containing radical SAM protein [Bradyrhizobium sp. WBOS7]MDD1599593.1 B12-binding domain-containing radical SAM prote